MITISELLLLATIITQIEKVYGTFGCCPIAIPCLPCACKPCLPPPCPPPPPPTICPPLPPPCPPPPICPPPIECPPPVICPPPPPPPPPPVPIPCPPPLPAPICPVSAPLPPPTYVVPVVNDCCCMCASPCLYSRMRMHGARIFTPSLDAELEHDPKCNDETLKSVMLENMTEDPTITKRAIQRAAEEKLSKKFNVICSKQDFSYVAYTETFCQLSNGEMTCYAFEPLDTKL